MADSDRTEEIGGDIQEVDESTETNETGDKPGEAEAIEKTKEESRAKPWSWIGSRIFLPSRSKKRSVLAIMLPLMALAAIGLTIEPKWFKKKETETPVQMGSAISQESLKEESLSPFFIPLSRNKNRRMARIDLSVVWSALASVKYSKNELRIRDQMFSQLISFAGENKDLDNGQSLLENDLKGILQNSLGIYNLEVKVREINYF